VRDHLDARHHARLAPRGPPGRLSDLLLRAVADARRLRGSVVVQPSDGRCWGAAVAAVDGSLEVRVSPPRRRFWQRETDEQRWLRERGFVFMVDAWHVALPASAADDEAARLLGETLAAVHHAEAQVRSFEHRGVHEDDVPPATAVPEEHVAAALRTLVAGLQRGVHVGGGRPHVHWATAWPVDGELLIERDEPGRPGEGSDEWRSPLTDSGCESAANELLRRIRADWPDPVPLFIHLLDHDK
jgi:hypothetical protein